MNEEQRKYFDEVSKQVLHAQITRLSFHPDTSELKAMAVCAIEVAKHMLELRNEVIRNK